LVIRPKTAPRASRRAGQVVRLYAYPVHGHVVIVIRRLTDRHRAYTGIFLPGEPARVFPTSDHEHARILEIYKQDRPHPGIVNDFSSLALGQATLRPTTAVHPPRAA
jgi:hypothetical protein